MASGVQVTSPRAESDAAAPLRIRVVSSPAADQVDTPEDSGGRTVKRRREEAAVFLEKTYELLDRCPPELAGWTSKGDSFVVKQPAAFAEQVIPTYFKHRKFSSFVRQLNLYGFRKVRAATAVPDDAEADDDVSPKGWWEFRHDRFLRGRRDLLCEIRRRSPSDGRASTPVGNGTPVDRAEFDELKAEVGSLREEMHKMQKINQQLTGLLQNILTRFNGDATASRLEPVSTPSFATSPSVAQVQHKSLPSLALLSPTTISNGPQQALLQLRQGTPTAGIRTPRTPSAAFHLRPVMSLMGNLSPSTRPSPSPRPNFPYMSSTPSGGSFAQQQQQDFNRQQQQRWFQAANQPQPSPKPTQSPRKRARVDSGASTTDPTAAYGLRSPEDVAVRQLSRTASEIRTDLLACITARVTGFLRVHRDQTETREADADAVGEAVGSDIRQKLAQLHASTPVADPMLVDPETTCMYRVEILKFISRELPRAVQEAVDRRLPAPEKLKQRPAKDRSLLALLVQKAQKALERQMHTETAAINAGRR